ncbi:uncharacterized protein LOC113931372 [Zalophus californianus]|uniref:Uncharacterized protein LOC113931372 n=1 Tax=Zalophus californianus TaxID=9704 RepID=A0A6J2EHI0_ZALCA|nr:uncharacterized protein LOC113931372 [Zalophus californianus]
MISWENAQIRRWVALHPWQQLLQKRLRKTRPGWRQKAPRLPSPSSWPSSGPRREHHASTCTRHAQPPFLRKSPDTELRLLLVPFPRRLIINEFVVSAPRHYRFRVGGSVCNQGAFRSSHSGSVCLAHPNQQASPPSGRSGRRHLCPLSVRPSPNWPALLSGLAGCGCSLPPLPCPALRGPGRPGQGALPPPGYQARGGAGPARPALAVEGARRVLLAVIPAWAFYLGAAGEAGGGDTGGGP